MDYSKFTDEQLEACQRDEFNATRGANIVRGRIRMWVGRLGIVGFILIFASLDHHVVGEIFDMLFILGCFVVFRSSGNKDYPRGYPFIDKNDPEWREKIIRRMRELDEEERSLNSSSSHDDSM